MAQAGTTKFSPVVRLILILLLGGVLLLFPVTLPSGAGDMDLQAYWGSAYLFAHGQDFSDSDALGEVQRTLANRTRSDTQYAWFSPIGNVILLPFTLIPFTKLVYYWLILNVVAFFYSTILIWEQTDRRVWIPLLAVFSFALTLISLIFGQINSLEVLGLALFLSLSKSNRHYLAGASLVLTTIKPHLVIITLPILFLDLLRKKEWKTLIGFFIALGFCFIVLFAFYPPWVQSFWTVMTSGMSTVRETPNINGLLVLIDEYTIGKLLWIITLIVCTVWWWLRGQNWDRRTFIDLSITVGLVVSPIGWSYDQVMLIFPILSLLSWAVNGSLPKQVSKSIVAILIIGNLAAYILRTFTPSDVWFFWVPFVVLGLYLITYKRLHNS
ncbi:MAG TPA: glycosyltransferase family 87 protein [Anaerolineales bacterium]|nr:glycosyltransferase family 87 protein [Anaerolineales bacterium]